MTVVDASGQIIGRFSSGLAKRLLGGEEIVVVSADKALITGSKAWLTAEFRHRRVVGSQRRGPFYPKRADRILHRAIRGMIPYQTPHGRAALKRLRVYGDVPVQFKEATIEKPAAPTIRSAKYMTLAEIAMRLGGAA